MCIVSGVSTLSTLPSLTFRERHSGHDVRIKGETITGWCSDDQTMYMVMIDGCAWLLVFPEPQPPNLELNMRVAPLLSSLVVFLIRKRTPRSDSKVLWCCKTINISHRLVGRPLTYRLVVQQFIVVNICNHAPNRSSYEPEPSSFHRHPIHPDLRTTITIFIGSKLAHNMAGRYATATI